MNTQNEKIFTQLEAKKQRLFNELASYSQETLLLPEKKGAWSVLECLHHLYITEWGTYTYIRKKTQKPELIPTTTTSAALKLLALRYTFGTPIKFKAPAVLPKTPADATLDSVNKDWSEVRMSLSALMHELPEDLQEKGIFKHPLAGRINMTQTLDFINFHFDRHERQVCRVLKAVV
jgi:hypothetical protein